MAAAEARAAWQRTANRYLVQEDAKRAPKLACCPSSSSVQHHDTNGGNATNGQDHSVANFMPLNWNPMSSTLPADTKWWLQLQPNHGSQKDFTCEQLNVLEGELDEESKESSVRTPKLGAGALDHDKSRNSGESPWLVSTAFMKSNSETRVEGMKTAINTSPKPLKRKVDGDDYFFHEELMDWKPGDRLINRKTEKDSPELETPWVGGNKCEPWWHVLDRDELALLVARKSLEHIENCDLPRPTQTMHVSTDPFGCLERLDGDRHFSSSAGSRIHTSICNAIDCPHHSFSSGSMDEKYWTHSDTNKLHRDPTFHTTAKDLQENTVPESVSSRAQLLEALRRSQTRARKAEMAAQKACEEKEDIIKILFRQASHLFAYKQWLHILQLESLSLQLRIKDHQLATLFPRFPWMPLKRNVTNKGNKRKKCSLCKYAVLFAVGLGLVGAGLLLGWTLGWLLPHL